MDAEKMRVSKLVVGELATNCYLVQGPNSDECVVIDPGGDGERILERIRELNYSVSHILLTHGHPDHILAIPDLKQAFPEARVVIHEADAPMLQDPADILIGSDPRRGLMLLTESRAKPLLREEGWLLAFQVIETPGHTPGGVCFYLPKNIAGKANKRSDLTGAGISTRVRSDLSEVVTVRKEEGGILFSGDTLFRRGIGRTDLPGGDYKQESRSVREKLLTLPPRTIVYPGHGPETTIGEEAAYYP